MAKVTDPALLAQLNAPDVPSGLKPVTDPDLLAQLNAPDTPDYSTGPQANGDNTGIGPRREHTALTKSIGSGIQATAEHPGGVARAVGQGVSLGFSDEGEAAARAAYNGSTYADEKKKVDERDAADRAALGKVYTAAELAGGVVPGMGMGRVAAELAPVGSTFARRAAVNTVVPGVGAGVQNYGSQEGEKSIGKAVGAGVVGGALGLGLTAAGEVIPPAYQFAQRQFLAHRERADEARHLATTPDLPLPTRPDTADAVARKAVDALELDGVNEATYRAQAAAARLPGEQSVAPGIANPALREAGAQSAKSIPSESYGGRGNTVQNYADQSLSQNGQTQADLLRGRVHAQQNLPNDPSTRVGFFNAERERSNQRIGTLANQGGGTRMDGAQQMADRYPWFVREYERAAATLGIRPQYYQDGRLRLPGDMMDVGIANQMRRVMSKAAGVSDDPNAQAQGVRAMDFFNNAANGQGVRGRFRQLTDAYRNSAGAHTAEERMTQGAQFAERSPMAEATAAAERRTITPREQTEQAAGTLYKLSSDIDQGASSATGAGQKLGKVADDYFGTADKRRSFTEWVRGGGANADPAFAQRTENELRQIGVRHEVADRLHNIMTNGKPPSEETAKTLFGSLRAMMFSSKTGGMAAVLQRMTSGMSRPQAYAFTRLVYDKTAMGEQAILREFARRAAVKAAAPARNLSRQQIMNYLIEQSVGRVGTGKE